jgi:hypothetical protein
MLVPVHDILQMLQIHQIYFFDPTPPVPEAGTESTTASTATEGVVVDSLTSPPVPEAGPETCVNVAIGSCWVVVNQDIQCSKGAEVPKKQHSSLMEIFE